MGKNHLKTPSGSGLELDKIEFPARPSLNTVRKSTPDPEQKSALPPETGSSGKKHFGLTLTAVLATVVLLAILAIYLKRQNLDVNFLSLKDTAVSDKYLRVGPISATMKNDEVIRLSLDIECENDSAKKRLAEKDSHIRDIILSVITSPDTTALLEKHQYDAVREKIKKRLEKIGGESIGEVYFAELITY